MNVYVTTLRPPKHRAAFTLLELLVVIGIVGLIIALVLPALGLARQQARRTACAANLREVVQAYRALDVERGGGPLAGTVVLPPTFSGSSSDLPSVLGDAARKRFEYVENMGPFPISLAPPQAHLLRQLGQTWSNAIELNVALGSAATGGPLRVMQCPSVSDSGDFAGDNLSFIVDAAPTSFTFTLPGAGDFAWNEGATGFHHNAAFAERRARGRLSSLKRAAETVLLTDARHDAGLMVWSPQLDVPNGTITLGDALRAPPSRASNAKLFDTERHRGKVNVAFADGHVMTTEIKVSELDAALLSAN